MRMRVEHRVHMGQLFAERLFAEVRTGVDHHHTLRIRLWVGRGSRQRNSTEGRSRRSCASVEVHTAHVHASVGTPIEVPVPRNVRVASMRSY